MPGIRRLTLIALATLSVALGGLPAKGNVALASLAHIYTGHSFGPEGLGGANFGGQQGVQGIAVDQSSGNVYVYVPDAEGGSVYKYDSAGEPVDFSKSAANVITGVGGGFFGENEIAVDSSIAGPAKGDVYVANNNEVRIYDGSTGEFLGDVTGGEACGVAVGLDGEAYVGFWNGSASSVSKYTPIGSPPVVGAAVSSLSALNGICNITVDSQGNIYGATFGDGPVSKYAASQFNTTGEPAALALEDGNASSLVADPSNDDVYLDDGVGIAEYDSSGKLLGRSAEAGSGAIGGSFGVAVHKTGDEVYASNGDGRVNIYGPAVLVADVTGGASSDITSNSATLEGVVDPNGEPVSACQFEYGTDTSYDSPPTPCSTAPGSGVTPVSVNSELSGLRAGTLYHYRLSAANANGTNQNSDGTFTTLPTAPAVNDRPLTASNITRTAALISGTVNPAGSDTTYHFLYGTTSAYGNSTLVLDAGSGGSGDESIGPIAVTELAPGTTYHYALSATNELGTTIGPDYTFTTGAPTPPAATTGFPTGVTQTAATLTAAIDTAGLKTFYGFQEGSEAGSYGPPIPVGSDTVAKTLTLTLEDLSPGSTYHYRVYATSQDGTIYGADQTFTTPGYQSPIAQPLAPPLIAVPPVVFPGQTASTGKSTIKSLTSAQRLARALKICKKKPTKKRAACRKQAKRKYASAKKK
ncbi:MAG TPA: hypothetical protein VK781_08760 [Solirubrobacteraceae bacterium]|jgi:hypothetical protein|nr:hypothetical protein [Solirubrobacteraceae bacterium]